MISDKLARVSRQISEAEGGELGEDGGEPVVAEEGELREDSGEPVVTEERELEEDGSCRRAHPV